MSRLVSDKRLGEPDTNRQLFDFLLQAGWLSPELTDTMLKMAGFRNVVVHGYQALDKDIVADIAQHRLDDLLDFVATIRRRLQSSA